MIAVGYRLSRVMAVGFPMRFCYVFVVALFLIGSEAKAGFREAFDNSRLHTLALRLSYDWGLGGGVGLHSSHWIDPVGVGQPIVGATGGVTFYRKGTRLYGGLQAGLLAGVGFGFYKQTGTEPTSGLYYDLWGVLPVLDMMTPGLSFRQYMTESPMTQTPVDLTLIGVGYYLVD